MGTVECVLHPACCEFMAGRNGARVVLVIASEQGGLLEKSGGGVASSRRVRAKHSSKL